MSHHSGRGESGFFPGLPLFLGISALVALWLLWRGLGLFPVVFADEYEYSLFSRHLPLSEAAIPGYLFLKLYGATQSCGEGFLQCARLLNVVAYILGCLAVFRVATLWLGRRLGFYVGLLTLLSPSQTYTVFFMPEALYFMGFWLLTGLLIKQPAHTSNRHAVAIGVATGLLSLIKPHALLLLPGVLLFKAFDLAAASKSNAISKALRFGAYILGGALLTKFGIGYLWAGSKGLTLFGSHYGHHASTALESRDSTVFFHQAMQNAWLQLRAVSIPFGLAFIALLRGLFYCNHATSDQNKRLPLLALLTLFPLIFVTALFTASVSGIGPHESIGRLHLRYYDFVFPLLYMVSALALKSASTKGDPKGRFWLTAPFLLFLAQDLWLDSASLITSLVDNPELNGLKEIHGAMTLMSLTSIGLIFIWLRSESLALRLYLFGALPLYLGLTLLGNDHSADLRRSPDRFDRGGLFAARVLNLAERSKLLVTGSDISGLYRALYHIDHQDALFLELKPQAALDPSQFPIGREWLLAFDDTPATAPSTRYPALDRVRLIPIMPRRLISLRKGAKHEEASELHGLSSPEPWGSWTESSTVEIRFTQPLPKRYILKIKGLTLKALEGYPVTLRTGGIEKSLRLGQDLSLHEFHIQAFQETRSLIFEIPESRSPRELGLGPDNRRLGIGLQEIEIIPDLPDRGPDF